MLYAAGSVRDVSVDAEDLCGLTWLGQFLWFADALREQVVAVDPYSAATVQTLACPGLRVGLATYGGHLVYVAGPDLRLHVVDPGTGAQVDRFDNPRPGQVCTGLEGGRSGLWLGYPGRLELRSPADLALVTTVELPGVPTGVAVTDRYLICSNRWDESITIVDPVLEQAVLPINVHGAPTGLAWDGTRIWYCDSAHSRLRAIDVPGLVRSG